MQTEYLYKINSINHDELLNFLIESDDDFLPKLSKRVDINSWAEKIIDNATIFETWDNNHVIALVIAYVNNFDTKETFVTYVYCKKDYRKKVLLKICFLKLKNIPKKKAFYQ